VYRLKDLEEVEHNIENSLSASMCPFTSMNILKSTVSSTCFAPAVGMPRTIVSSSTTPRTCVSS